MHKYSSGSEPQLTSLTWFTVKFAAADQITRASWLYNSNARSG